MDSEKGFIVYEDGGTSLLDYGASEKWFPSYDEAVEYAMEIVKRRIKQLKKYPNFNSVVVYEGTEAILHEEHSWHCGTVVFNWRNYDNYLKLKS